MKPLTGNDIREMFLRYFESKGHRRVRSSSLVPANDPTLLFTNAGMNQFKDVFLGLEKRDYNKATSSQKCVRAGGKHNDLENVGFTNRHHTFFEMLGNFSFGDYFKKDAIAFAFELITSPDWFGIPRAKLYFTVFGQTEVGPGQVVGSDHEAIVHWVNVGAPRDRIFEVPGLKENFWAMGDTGPCGPCSEIHYDMGPHASELGHGVTSSACSFPCDCGRYVEIWNLVFMQFNRDTEGRVSPLPNPSIDTGAGLERLACALLNIEDPTKVSNYDTDFFAPLIKDACLVTGEMYGRDVRKSAALRVIADHARAATFLIADGLIPSNEGRGYVLRKIIRRACDFGRQLNLKDPFLFDMAKIIAPLMKDPYPELEEYKERIAKTIKLEEEKYARLVVPAEEQLVKRFAKRPLLSGFDAVWEARSKQGLSTAREIEEAKARRQFEITEGRLLVQGADLFYAYSTLGLRPDQVRDIAAANGWFVMPEAEAEFEESLAKEKERGKVSWKGGHKEIASPVYAKLAELYRTETDFYYEARAKDCRIEAIVTKDGVANEIAAGAEAEIVLDRTAFYAESGGQMADIGALWNNEQTLDLAEVRGAYYPVSGLIAHKIVAKENLRVGDRVACVADGARREHIKRNHTATHLMHAALRNILGTHVKQAGSLVAPERLRFDFSHFAAVDPAELRDIEEQVNDQIRCNAELATDLLPLEEALASGALAFFGERYPENNVRVVTIPDPNSPRGFYSKELCGGTHVRRSGDIGVFKITVEQASSAGVRRIEAITGATALAEFQRAKEILAQLSGRLGVNEENLAAALERNEQSQRQLEKQLETLKRKSAHSKLDELLEQAREIKGVKVISAEVENADRETLRQLSDSLRQKLGSGVVVLGAVADDKVALLAGVTKDLIPKLHAGKIAQELAQLVGGKGGGRPDLAEAGGKDTSALKKALLQVVPLVERML